jgi:hypothetical protein
MPPPRGPDPPRFGGRHHLAGLRHLQPSRPAASANRAAALARATALPMACGTWMTISSCSGQPASGSSCGSDYPHDLRCRSQVPRSYGIPGTGLRAFGPLRTTGRTCRRRLSQVPRRRYRSPAGTFTPQGLRSPPHATGRPDRVLQTTATRILAQGHCGMRLAAANRRLMPVLAVTGAR